MSLALVQSRALLGLAAPPVTVEVHLANGLPSFTLVGLADVEVKEARERVRSALLNAGLQFPSNKKITVNLAPADLPKDSGRFDLPIALGILAASGQMDAAQLSGWEFAGELSLSGQLRAVRGALATALALHTGAPAAATTRMVLPPGSAEEAALVPGATVYRAEHLLDVVQQFLPLPPEEAAVPSSGWQRLHYHPERGWRQHGGLQLDLSGIAKGYAVDAVLLRLHALGLPNALVEIGGELRGSGQRTAVVAVSGAGNDEVVQRGCMRTGEQVGGGPVTVGPAALDEQDQRIGRTEHLEASQSRAFGFVLQRDGADTERRGLTVQ